MKPGVALALIALSGCATDKMISLPDGHQGHSIRCDGAALSWETCYEKAGEVCPVGYDIVAKEGEQSPVIAGNQYGIYGGARVHRTMIISCKQ